MRLPVAAAFSSAVKAALVPSWLTGPIFDKELRVSSRRRRNYVLRFVYVALLTMYVALVWLSAVRFGDLSSGAYGIARMSEAGRAIIGSIVWLQFGLAQFVALIMLSNAVSDEIYHRTLGVLMTTPINSFQIVMGKLLSKLLQLLILLAISLPLLAVVRVFGGVPWNFVVASLCITLTAVIFAASLSIYFSIHNRRAYAAILKALAVLASLYLLLPVLVVLVCDSYNLGGGRAMEFFCYVNPFLAMIATTSMMMSPGGLPFSFPWPLHCLIMLGASAAILAMSVLVVRKVALRQATGEAGLFLSRGKRRAMAASEPSAKAIRAVRGSPVVWKELRTRLLQSRTKAVIAGAGALAVLAATYLLCARQGWLEYGPPHIVYVAIFVLVGITCTAVLSATTITSEKESRCWPILLATPLSDWQILNGKFAGVFRRCLPVWGLLAAHVLLFVLVGYIHVIALLHLAMLVTWLIAFLTGTGLYFSARFRRTTTAVVMNIGLCLAIWLIVPLILSLVSLAANFDTDDFVNPIWSTNPVVQAGVIMEATGGEDNAGQMRWDLDYDWPDGWGVYGAETLGRMSLYMVGYGAVGLAFAWRARKALRKRIF